MPSTQPEATKTRVSLTQTSVPYVNAENQLVTGPLPAEGEGDRVWNHWDDDVAAAARRVALETALAEGRPGLILDGAPEPASEPAVRAAGERGPQAQGVSDRRQETTTQTTTQTTTTTAPPRRGKQE
jgi:hypothetical protein